MTTGEAKIAINPTSAAGLNYANGTSITFEVNVTNAPSINSFAVSVQYNPSVLEAISIDFTSSTSYVLGESALAYHECIDDRSLIGDVCTNLDDIGVVTLYATLLGTGTKAPTNGPLFNVTFTIIHPGFSEIHLLYAQVIEFISVGSSEHPRSISSGYVPSLGFDGYFSDVECYAGTLCTPPVPVVYYYPSFSSLTSSLGEPVFFVGEPVLFDASKSSPTNPAATIVSYTMIWRDGSPTVITTNSSIEHIYMFAGELLFTLKVTDSYGISAFTSVLFDVSEPYVVFSLTALPDRLNITARTTGTVYLSSRNPDSTTQVINLTISAPKGLSVAPSVATITSPGSVQLTLTAQMRLHPGVYFVSVTGLNSAVVMQTITITVTVLPRN